MSSTASLTSVKSVALLYVNGAQRENVDLSPLPFTVGRRVGNSLVIPDPSVSRDHAQIVKEGSDYYIIDCQSKHGTFVNDAPITRHRLVSRDRITFAKAASIYLVFDAPDTGSGRNWINELSVLRVPGAVSELEQLKSFLEVVRRFDATRAVDEIIVTLLEFSLQVTHAERAFLYVTDETGLRLAFGRAKDGRSLTEDNTISHSVLNEAAESASEFLITDTQEHAKLKARDSIIAHNLRSIICMPLRSRSQEKSVAGVLYLDSHVLTADFTDLSEDILRALATDAAGILENIRLAEADERARRFEQEMAIAGAIQQQLLAVTIPNCPFASAKAGNVSCKEVGGDFFDIVATPHALYFVLADVSGKGISAALLASVLQGVTYSHFIQDRPLMETVTSANSLLCGKHLQGKYATLIVGRLDTGGHLSFINCGHLPPLRVTGDCATFIDAGNLPVGLFPNAVYEQYETQLSPGERIVIVSDGVTEAENIEGEFFGDERLIGVVKTGTVDHIFSSVKTHCGGLQFNDDCSVLDVTFIGNCNQTG
jgi:serine phosphatase RsbU (regulator of sigma subunit)/pSer/pThr/pTyr-binding forkhead associated (FHA) protein